MENPNWFIDQLALYQNANSSPEAVKRNFLIRIAEFERIIAALRNKAPGDPLQHELILGWRGSGKSTLLRRIQIEIDELPDLAAQYIAINLAEEQNAIYRLSDLWFEVLQELIIRLKQRLDLRPFDDFESEQAYSRYLYAKIATLLEASQKRAVLLLDNIDRIFENIGDDGNLLRETLINYRDVQIIGASTRISEHFWRHDLPFFNFFRLHRLEGLQFEEIHRLFNHWSAEMNLPQLHDYTLRFRGRVEAMRILTNGLPRALQFFIQILLHDASLYGFDYLRKVMDRATPLYQERLQNLTAAQRKIVQEMAFWWEAAPTKILAEKCRMESKLMASYLKQLEQYGIVEIVPTEKRNHLYRLKERFFNMWLIVTQGNPDQKRRAKYLTLFLETWYDGGELKGLAVKHLAALREGKLGYDKALVLSKGLAHSKYISVEERDELIDLTTQLNKSGKGSSEMPRTYAEIWKEIEILKVEEKFEAALEKIEEIENEGDGVKFFLKAYCLDELKRYEESAEYYQRASERGSVNALFNLALLYQDQGKKSEAITYYLLAIEKGNADALYNLALLYQNQGKKTEAETYYLLAIEKGEMDALNNLAVLYFETNQNPKAALEYALEYLNKTGDESQNENIVLLEIWNGIFDNLDEKIEHILQHSKGEGLEWFLTNLLNLEQKQLVLNLFESPEHGKMLQDRYELLYYATRILAQKTKDNLLLRIPPEVMPTVQDIVEKVKEKQAFYAKTPQK